MNVISIHRQVIALAGCAMSRPIFESLRSIYPWALSIHITEAPPMAPPNFWAIEADEKMRPVEADPVRSSE